MGGLTRKDSDKFEVAKKDEKPTWTVFDDQYPTNLFVLIVWLQM